MISLLKVVSCYLLYYFNVVLRILNNFPGLSSLYHVKSRFSSKLQFFKRIVDILAMAEHGRVFSCFRSVVSHNHSPFIEWWAANIPHFPNLFDLLQIFNISRNE